MRTYASDPSSAGLASTPPSQLEALHSTVAELTSRITICHQSLQRAADRLFGVSPSDVGANGRGPSEIHSLVELLNFLAYEVEDLEAVVRRF